jgi:hypothetical protein
MASALDDHSKFFQQQLTRVMEMRSACGAGVVFGSLALLFMFKLRQAATYSRQGGLMSYADSDLVNVKSS